MPPILSTRPAKLNLDFYPGEPIVLTFDFPASWLSTRVLKAFLNGRGDDGVEGTIVESGDSITLTFAATDTDFDVPVPFELDIFDATPNPDTYVKQIVGTWRPGTTGAAPTTGNFTVNLPADITVSVTTNSPGVDGVVQALVAGTNVTVDNTDPANPIVAAAAITNLAGINAQTGTSYTLVLTDAGKLVTMNNAAANTLTVPPQASVAWVANTQVHLAQLGAGQTTIVAGSGVTINGQPGLKITGQYRSASLIRLASNSWLLVGALSA